MQKNERIISVYRKEDETLVDEINVDHISLDKLRSIFKPSAEDLDLRYGYHINLEIAAQLFDGSTLNAFPHFLL